MSDHIMRVALISDVFFDNNPAERLADRLHEAKKQDAHLAVLPELALNPWSPATKTPRDEDAEAPDGPRAAILAHAARSVGIGLLGGAIIRDERGRRFNTALTYDANGTLRGSFRKCHVPEEPGFWETSHYEYGMEPPEVVEGFPLRFGVQICSDVNRPQGSHILAALGAQAVIAPRASELKTYPRWNVVFRANALTCGLYYLSVNRPAPEFGVLMGGPSVAVNPDGVVIAETTDPVCVVSLDRRVVEKAKVDYPGYLPIHADVYARAWRRIADAR